MPLFHQNGGLVLRALKYAVNEAQKRQHSETGHGPEAHQMRTHFNIIIYPHPDHVPPRCSGYSVSQEIVTMDRSKMSPGDGTPEGIARLASEASLSLLELSKLSKRVGALKAQFDDITDHSHWPGEREKMQPVLSKLSRVQDETTASIALSTRLIRGHLDFCHNMQSTLRHGANAGGSDCRLSHDSAVVSAGAVVSERFAALGEHIATLQGMILDVAQELRGLGERGQHPFRHPRSHHLWGKVRRALPELLRAVMLVISWIGKILGLVHPVANIVGEIAQGVHDFLGNHPSAKHTSSGKHSTSGDKKHKADSESHHSDSDEAMALLDYICDETPTHIAQIKSGIEHVYSTIEQPMLKVEKQLNSATQCFRMHPRDAQIAADLWGDLAQKLEVILRMHGPESAD